jgi:hypothetical protein
MIELQTHAVHDLLDYWFLDGEAEESMVDAIMADGWSSEQLVLAGCRRHGRTWQARALDDAIRDEYRALDDPTYEATFPDSIAHIWPGLPGAGVTPVLFGLLLGVDQIIRPPSGSGHFARWLADSWARLVDAFDGDASELRVIEPADETWLEADRVVVSGSDQTLNDVIARRLQRTTGRPKVTGYGHRVSMGLVADLGEWSAAQRATLARKFATDVVLWHQQGCFSARGLLVGGTDAQVESFAEVLGQAIEEREEDWDAVPIEDSWISERANKRGLADFQGTRRGDGFGWAQLEEEPWSGELIAPHVLTVHRFDPEADPTTVLSEHIDVPIRHLQGVALASNEPDRWHRALAARGFTRICRPGRLQAPPAGWWHDGRPNILDWLDVTTLPSPDE